MHLPTLGIPTTRARNCGSKRVNRLLDAALGIGRPRGKSIPVLTRASECILPTSTSSIIDLILLELVCCNCCSPSTSSLIIPRHWLFAMCDDNYNQFDEVSVDKKQRCTTYDCATTCAHVPG